MFRQRFVFNIVGEKALVDKASVEIKNIISDLTKEPVDIMIEDKSTIFHRISINNKNVKYFYINKCYIDSKNDIAEQAIKITELSRHIRNQSRDTVHPWNLHVENVDSIYVSDFMKNCSQINCVYPLNALDNFKKGKIELFIK